VKLQAHAPAAYLVGGDVIDRSHSSIKQFAATLRAEHSDDVQKVSLPAFAISESPTTDRPFSCMVSPHPDVVRALRGATDVLALCRGGLPSHLDGGPVIQSQLDGRHRPTSGTGPGSDAGSGRNFTHRDHSGWGS